MLFRKGQAHAVRSTRYLVLLFIVLIIGITLVANAVLALAWMIGSGGVLSFPKYFFEVNTAGVLLYVFGSYLVESMALKGGGEFLAMKAGGRKVDEPQTLHEKRLKNVVMEVAVAAGVRPPKIFLLSQEDSINAFAAGWRPNDSVIAVTRGAIERLTRDELQGVVAHEFSHILNGDMRLNMRLMGMVLGLQMLFGVGTMMIHAGGERGWIPLKLLIGLAFMGVGWLGWLAGRILSASVSRQREYLADATAVKYTRLTEGIAGALRKIAYQQQSGRADFKVEEANSIAPMYLHYTMASKWLATHPPISERLKRLGVPYTRFEVEDEPQRVRSDDFMLNRLVPQEEMTSQLKMAAARWGGAHVNQGAGQYYGFLEELPAIEMPAAEGMAEMQAELYLESPLSMGTVQAAILAFWVTPEDNRAAKQWEECSKESATQLPFRALSSVHKLGLKAREPIFETLVLKVQTCNLEERIAFAAKAEQLFQALSTPQLIDWLRLAVLEYWMGDFRESMSNEYSKLKEVESSITLMTSFMATALEVKDPNAWVVCVLEELELKGVYSNSFQPKQLNRAIKDIHDGVSLFAPMIMSAWLNQWRSEVSQCSPLKIQANVDCFRLMASLLDMARPAEIEAHYKEAKRNH